MKSNSQALALRGKPAKRASGGRLVLALAIALAVFAMTSQSWADDDHWNHDPKHHDQDWDHNKHHRVAPPRPRYVYAPPPRVIYAPPPQVIVAPPPPAIYLPPPPSLQVVVPLHIN
jgi:hypothetical protein